MRIGWLLFCAIVSAAESPAASKAELQIGAARIDITPGKDESLHLAGYAARKEGYKGVHDGLYVRAIALRSGAVEAAILTADLVSLAADFRERVTRKLNLQTGIPEANILIAATHTHSAPVTGAYEIIESGSAEARYIARVEQAMADALVEARRTEQPGRIGAAAGRANVNVNRVAQMGDGSWFLGYNPDGPSDKTVAVVKFEKADGQPLSILMNYAVHGTGMGQESFLVSADVPGAASRYVEQHFGDTVVAPFTSGAAGDQCPIYDRAPARFDGVLAIGRILGEEVIRTAGTIRTRPDAAIQSAERVVTCPGRSFVRGPHGRKDGHFEDSPPVDIRLSLLRINDIALAGVSGEVLTMIGQRLKGSSPLPNTIMVTHCNGSSGYLPDDDAYARVGYEIQTTRVAPGCAEKAIVDGFVDMLRSTGR